MVSRETKFLMRNLVDAVAAWVRFVAFLDLEVQIWDQHLLVVVELEVVHEMTMLLLSKYAECLVE